MLGMTVPHSLLIDAANGQTLRLSTVNAFIWNPDVDYSTYIPIGQTGYFPTPLSGSYASPGTTTYFDSSTRQYVNLPWLVRGNGKNGEATIDISGLNLTPYTGTDVGSTPYKVCIKDQAGEAWGFIGAAGGGPAETEMLTGWTESVQGSYDFDVFTTSGSTITKMEIVDTLGKDGLAYTNNFTLVEGHRYRLAVNVTHTGGFHYYPDLYLGVPETVGRLLKDDLLETENRIEFVADASDATQTCVWLYLGGESEWSNCTFTMKDITGPVTGDELLTGWTNVDFDTFTSTGSTVTSAVDASTGTAKSNAITFVAGRKYRIYTTCVGCNQVRVRLGSSGAMDGRNVGYLEWSYPNYFEFTATAADVTGGYLWISSGTYPIDTAVFSLKELTEQNVSLGGAHIVSTDGGSTRNWSSVSEGFDWNDIRSYQLMTKDAILLTEKRYRIQVRDISANKWARGWLGEIGEGTHENHSVLGITKANPGVISFGEWDNPNNGALFYLYNLTEMTELNNKYVTVVSTFFSNSRWHYNIVDTSGYGAAETTGGADCLEMIVSPPNTALVVYSSATEASIGWESIETGFDPNRTDYEVYITLER